MKKERLQFHKYHFSFRKVEEKGEKGKGLCLTLLLVRLGKLEKLENFEKRKEET